MKGLFLYVDRVRNQVSDLRIATLNSDGKLDWDGRSAFVFFDGAPNKMAHPYKYRCVTDSKGS